MLLSSSPPWKIVKDAPNHIPCIFRLQSVSPQPMLRYVVLIATIKVLYIKMISQCPIYERGKLIVELLVSELGVV